MPNDSCRILVLSDLPRGINEYDDYRLFVFEEWQSVYLAQKIEQGIGRASRGSSDYSVVIMLGKALSAWLRRSENQNLLTVGTRAQIEIGFKVSDAVDTVAGLKEVITQCLNRDKDWIEFHANNLDSLYDTNENDMDYHKYATLERKTFQLMRDGNFSNAISKIDKFLSRAENLSAYQIAWLKYLNGRLAYLQGNYDLYIEYQKDAYSRNKNLPRPPIKSEYKPTRIITEQASKIRLLLPSKRYRRTILEDLDKIIHNLSPTASYSQYEEALRKFGEMLGFESQRPDNDNQEGPDVLWLGSDENCFVIEVKSDKNTNNPFTKSEHGQLMVAMQWFEKHYPKYEGIAISIHPNNLAYRDASTNNVRVLTFDKLTQLTSNARKMYKEIVEDCVSNEEIDLLITKYKLSPQDIISEYSSDFEETPSK
ncbi:MAG: hypothetical protein AAF846_28905 [Chloroflexota bacterium]